MYDEHPAQLVPSRRQFVANLQYPCNGPSPFAAPIHGRAKESQHQHGAGRGVPDADGVPYVPAVVRLGLHIHHTVQAVALDTLVEQRMAGGEEVRGVPHGVLSF